MYDIEQKARADFEVWARRAGYDLTLDYDVAPAADGHPWRCACTGVREIWCCWQVALASQPQAPAAALPEGGCWCAPPPEVSL